MALSMDVFEVGEQFLTMDRNGKPRIWYVNSDGSVEELENRGDER